MTTAIKQIDKSNTDLKNFIDNIGESVNTFTYFNSRDVTVIDNHILTVLLYKNKEPIGYGHLDQDNGIIWLGICVIEKEIGKGYGKKIMKSLLDFADKKKLSLKLSVNRNNLAAQKLYKHFDFVKIYETQSNIFMNRYYED
jgi:RimJ/RimL family protein N-acetyltransferase